MHFCLSLFTFLSDMRALETDSLRGTVAELCLYIMLSPLSHEITTQRKLYLYSKAYIAPMACVSIHVYPGKISKNAPLSSL